MFGWLKKKDANKFDDKFLQIIADNIRSGKWKYKSYDNSWTVVGEDITVKEDIFAINQFYVEVNDECLHMNWHDRDLMYAFSKELLLTKDLQKRNKWDKQTR